MKKNLLFQIFITLGAATVMTSCAPATPPYVDVIATAALKQAYIMQTMTVLAASPTPTMTFTPSPTPTETLTPEPTARFSRPVVTAFAGCWTGPGRKYKLVSYIEAGKNVNLVGIGGVPGWYIIHNPYYRNKPCWIEAIYLKLDPRVDTSTYPTVIPANP